MIKKKRIGDFLIEKGLIDPAQLPTILEYSRKHGLRMGDACVQMGLITVEDLRSLFGNNYEADFYHLETPDYPPQTTDLFPVSFLVKHGVLPLGVETVRTLLRSGKLLKIGLLNPENNTAVSEIEKTLPNVSPPGSFQGVKIFLVVPEQFHQILKSVYDFSEKDLKNLGEGEIDRSFAAYLKRRK